MKTSKPPERLYNSYTFAELVQLLTTEKKSGKINMMGLCRSLLENEQLSLEERLQLRDLAAQNFTKQVAFLQVKDPVTYLRLSLLGKEYTKADEEESWRQIVRNQQAILKEKGISHRNFGTYSIHDCGVESCPFNGMMIRQGSEFAESSMHFKSDRSRVAKKQKSMNARKDRKKNGKFGVNPFIDGMNDDR